MLATTVGIVRLVGALALAQSSAGALVDQAQKQISDVQFRQAAKTLALARDVHGHSHALTVRILALTGVVAASLGDKAEAVAAFRQLVVIEPKFAVDPAWSPKVRSPFYEARGWADEHGTLQLVDLPPKVEQRQVKALELRLANDPLRLVTQVRVHLAGVATPLLAPLTAGADLAEVAVPPASEVRWWAELLDDKESVLVSLGAADLPKVASAGPASAPSSLAATSTASSASAAASTPTAAVSAEAPSESPPLRPLAYGLAIGGAVALGAGVYFGVTSGSLTSQLGNLPKDAQGHITGTTEKQAYSMNSQATTDATIANILYGVGAAAAAAGVGLWIYGALEPSSGEAVSVRLAPTAGGAVASVVWP